MVPFLDGDKVENGCSWYLPIVLHPKAMAVVVDEDP